MGVYELVAPATLLKHMCKAQKAICEEFIEDAGVETFNRIVSLVNDVANVQRPTKKIRVVEDQVFIQAVYKIVLLAQGMKKDASLATEFGFNMFWKELPPPPLRLMVWADPPPSDNWMPLTPLPADNKVFFYKRKRAKKAVSKENMQEAAD